MQIKILHSQTLNTVEKIKSNVKNHLPNTRLLFCTLTIQKDKKDLSEKVFDINGRLKN